MLDTFLIRFYYYAIAFILRSGLGFLILSILSSIYSLTFVLLLLLVHYFQTTVLSLSYYVPAELEFWTLVILRNKKLGTLSPFGIPCVKMLAIFLNRKLISKPSRFHLSHLCTKHKVRNSPYTVSKSRILKFFDYSYRKQTWGFQLEPWELSKPEILQAL